jgi:hypothetical protein
MSIEKCMEVNLISYKEFGRLRMAEFWPERTRVVPVSLIECWLGSGDGESVEFSYFLWPPSHRGEVSEIRLEAFPTEDCPESLVGNLLQRIRLPLNPGDDVKAVTRKLGKPLARRRSGDDTVLEFRVGVRDSYFVYCAVSDQAGLCHLAVVRWDRVKID